MPEDTSWLSDARRIAESVKSSSLKKWPDWFRKQDHIMRLARGLKKFRTAPGRDSFENYGGKVARLMDTIRESGLGGPMGPALLAAVVFGGYEATRYRPLGGISRAVENGARIQRLEHSLGVPDETRVQNWALKHPALVIAANWFYLAGHFPLTGATLAWVYRRRTEHQRLIPALLFTTAASFAVMFAYPLAPPRLMEGYGSVDTMEVFGPYIYDSPQVDATANQYAAMPSLHVAWALWVAWTLIQTTDSRWRWLILAHPALTSAGVVVTANHFWLDGIVGAALLAASVRIAGNLYPREAPTPP